MIRLPLLLTAMLLVDSAGGQSIRFRNVSAEANVHVQGPGLGVAISDYDRDGWDDLFIASANAPSSLFRNAGDGSFEDVTAAAGIDLVGRYTASLWADLDNDGFEDLYAGGYRSDARLYRNLGDGTFADVSAFAGIVLDDNVGSAAFADFDGDGLVDLFVAADLAPDRLYRNVSVRGAIAFEDVTTPSLAGPPHSVAMQVTWFDFDHDGDQDLFAVHDGTNYPNRLYVNDGFGGLREQASSRGIAQVGAGNSMGVAWGDYDGDGWEDVYVSRIGIAGLYRNGAGNRFEMIGSAAGAERNGMAWGTVFADFENDGDLDIFVVNESGFDHTPTLLYENRLGTFSEVGGPALASHYLSAQGLAQADLNRDGLVDLVFPGSDGSVRILQGASTSPGNWLSIELSPTVSNRSAIGARVEVDIDGKTLTRWVSGGDSFCSQSSGRLHFGLGDAPGVDAVRVFWGAGRIDTLGATPAGSFVEVVEGATTTAVEGDLRLHSTLRVGKPYPNPSVTGDFRIGLENREGMLLRMQVYDVTGRMMGEQQISRPEAGSSLLLGRLRARVPGVYFVRVYSDDTSVSFPLVFRPQ